MAAKFLRGDLNLPGPGRIVLTGRGSGSNDNLSEQAGQTAFGPQT
jgi:hypothetical protein